NNDYFILMRSKDGLNFEEIAKVNGAGNSNIVLNYSFIDKHPFFGNSYYKLKQVDFNGDYNYSVTREVKLSKQGSSFSIYPNPVTNNLYLSINCSNNITKVYEIKDLMGKTIKRDSLSSDAFLYVVSLQGLANGFYLIEVFCGVEKWTEKFQVFQ
ncbi:MAG TPA: T9SS type A sorting domain-containing protein, partial [Pyrinomonadaceae bacterium]|nr:T9SS type A sorting domain-containing protein [Pyrinomonadaceae bacterium]